MTDYFSGQTNYSYDALGRLTSLTNPFGEVTTFQYDANSRLIRKNLANGTYTTYSYNSRGFLTGIYNYKSNGTLLTYATYTYDAVGNRLSMSTPEGNYTYSYDAIYRLTGEVNPIGGTYSYTYDAVGNRLSMTHNGQTINYVYDAGNKLLQAGNTTFTYDGNGNMVSKTENGQTTTYVYNYEDKMVQVNLPNGSTIVYSYDHSGKRIAKTADGTTIDYYFDGDDLITEAQGANILAYYTQGQGLLSQRRNNASYFYHYDGLGSTKALTDANQNIQNTTKYDAWGNILQSSGTITNPYLYVGELGYYGDGDAGMYLLTQRWYNPVIGRFAVRDPSTTEFLYLYHYVSQNPVLFIDPTGMGFWDWISSGWKKCCKAIKKFLGSDLASFRKIVTEAFVIAMKGGPLDTASQILKGISGIAEAPEDIKDAMDECNYTLKDTIRLATGPHKGDNARLDMILNCTHCCTALMSAVGLSCYYGPSDFCYSVCEGAYGKAYKSAKQAPNPQPKKPLLQK
jgi:RHS repeat-associated protein